MVEPNIVEHTYAKVVHKNKSQFMGQNQSVKPRDPPLIPSPEPETLDIESFKSRASRTGKHTLPTLKSSIFGARKDGLAQIQSLSKSPLIVQSQATQNTSAPAAEKAFQYSHKRVRFDVLASEDEVPESALDQTQKLKGGTSYAIPSTKSSSIWKEIVIPLDPLGTESMPESLLGDTKSSETDFKEKSVTLQSEKEPENEPANALTSIAKEKDTKENVNMNPIATKKAKKKKSRTKQVIDESSTKETTGFKAMQAAENGQAKENDLELEQTVSSPKKVQETKANGSKPDSQMEKCRKAARDYTEKSDLVSKLFDLYQHRKQTQLSFEKSKESKKVSLKDLKSRAVVLKQLDNQIEVIESQLVEITNFEPLKKGNGEEKNRSLKLLQETILKNAGLKVNDVEEVSRRLEQMLEQERTRLASEKTLTVPTKPRDPPLKAVSKTVKKPLFKTVSYADVKEPLAVPLSSSSSPIYETPSITNVPKAPPNSPVIDKAILIKEVSDEMANCNVSETIPVADETPNPTPGPLPVVATRKPRRVIKRKRLGQTKEQFEKSLKAWSNFHLTTPRSTKQIDRDTICFVCEYSLFITTYFKGKNYAKVDYIQDL